MSKAIAGFQNQTWRIIKYDGLEELSEERVPLAEATEAEIIERIESLAAAELSPTEKRESPHLFRARNVTGNGKRLIYSAGENPHYAASLWRADELEA